MSSFIGCYGLYELSGAMSERRQRQLSSQADFPFSFAKLIVAWIMIVRRILENRSRLNGNGTLEFELVKGNDEAMDVDDVLNRSNARGPLRRSNTGSTTLYDSKEGTYEREGEEDDIMQRTETAKTKSKLVSFRPRYSAFVESCLLRTSYRSLIASVLSGERSGTQGSRDGDRKRFC